MTYLDSYLILLMTIEDYNRESTTARRQRRRVIVDQCLEVVKRFEDCPPYDNSCTNVFIDSYDELVIRDVLAAIPTVMNESKYYEASNINSHTLGE
jgi:hypothetical protein